ncbi:MAG: hypothetical protein RBQ91_01440 [Acholeplasma sp.]|nr:hypothetical protein [Acholeplasma sp.]
MLNSLDKDKIEANKRFTSLLKGIEAFIERHPVVTYIEFDYYVVHDMTLFSIEPNFDFESLEQTIEKLNKAIPAIKRIFSKPIIVLKDTDDVLPVENARIINQNTFLHLANHSQHVENITKKGVKPRKLLTRVYEDDYAIYENVVFCNLVDEILYFIAKNRRILNNLLYTSDIMRFNLLEKVNHLNYFLAIGKLHTGYIRDFGQYLSLSNRLLAELNQINKAIQPRLNKAVYLKNKHRNQSLPLKKTNIFLMQKDYKQVYKTYKYLSGKGVIKPEFDLNTDQQWINHYYQKFVQMLTLFSLSHYNFELDPKVKMDLNNLHVQFTYLDWKVTLQNNENDSLLLYFKKDTYYRIMIVGDHYDIDKILKEKTKRRLHDVVIVNPIEDDYLGSESVYVSMDDIDSFRRIQQVILKGMIYSDSKKEVCPFCGGNLLEIKGKPAHQCNNCQLQILKAVCTKTNESYYYTRIPNHAYKSIQSRDIKDDNFLSTRHIETEMFYKNITKLDEHSNIVCPHCRGIHKETEFEKK